MIKRIDTLCMVVRDIELASQWYAEMLGFEVDFQGSGYRVLSIGKGSVPLTLEEGDVDGQKNQSYPIFFSEDIIQTYEELKQKGIRVESLQKDLDNHYFNFYDLDDNRMQVCFFEE